MQTFLPYPDFGRSAKALDNVRLGKQRVEVLQILRALHVPGYGWRNHPAVLMWRGYEEALAAYGLAICREWCARGFADTCESKIIAELRTITGRRTRIRPQAELRERGRLPPWLGRRSFLRSHRAALLRKDPGWYGDRFSGTPPNLELEWPVRAADQR